MWGQAWGMQRSGRRGRGETYLLMQLPSEDDAAGLAFEAADVPFPRFVQRQERLLDLLLAPSAVCKDKRTQ